MELRDEIENVGFATGQSREDVLAGFDAIVQRTGDMAFARDVMRDLGIASTAAGPPMSDLGALASNLQQKLGLASGEIKTALGILNSQGKEGAFTLENMAAQGERLFSAAGRFDVRGLHGLREFGALIQTARMGTGSSEQATTAIENALADILDKQKQIRRIAGFEIFKPGTKNELKSVAEVIKGIIAGTGGDTTKLQEIFGRESIRGIGAMAQMYRETNGFAIFDKLVAGGDPGETMRDFARYSQDASFQLQQIQNFGTSFFKGAAGPALKMMADNLQRMTSDPARMDAFRQSLAMVASDLGNLAAFAGELANNPVVKALLLNPLRAVGAYSDLIDASASNAGMKDEINSRTAAGYNSMPEAERARIGARIAAGEDVNLQREVVQWQTRQKLALQNKINVTVNVADGRVTTETDDLNTEVSAKSNRGSLHVR
jgi:hypothetical protein